MVLSLLLISNRYVYSKAHLNAPILRQFASSSVTASGRKSIEGTANRASVRLYRILLKQLKALPELSEQNEWMLQPSLHSRDYGHARLWKGGDKIDISVPNMFRAWKAVDSGGDQEEFDLCTWITTEHLRQSIQEEFRSVNQVPLHEQHRQAIDAAQSLVDQLRLIQHSSVSVSEDGNLRVIATSR
mmetsp:Transcript_9247/g.13329  ORF Transcript_9247/g.13329 Transcript_9247/m.13329 type:complete len:186 (-) Transcript_9247:87-644(-)